jgi:hypothetical protein
VSLLLETRRWKTTPFLSLLSPAFAKTYIGRDVIAKFVEPADTVLVVALVGVQITEQVLDLHAAPFGRPGHFHDNNVFLSVSRST